MHLNINIYFIFLLQDFKFYKKLYNYFSQTIALNYILILINKNYFIYI